MYIEMEHKHFWAAKMPEVALSQPIFELSLLKLVPNTNLAGLKTYYVHCGSVILKSVNLGLLDFS